MNFTTILVIALIILWVAFTITYRQKNRYKHTLEDLLNALEDAGFTIEIKKEDI